MILRACATIFVSPFQLIFLFRASGALVFRGLDASSRVACARRRVSVDKVLQLKPSVAPTKSNNAMLRVRRRSDTFSIGTTIRYILPQRTFRASIPFPSSLFRVCVSSSSASCSSSAFPLDAIGLVPSLRRSPPRASDRSLSSILDARSLDRIVAHSVDQARSPSI